MSKNKFYPNEDINDLIESEEGAFFKGDDLEKGRGPDLKPRKRRLYLGSQGDYTTRESAYGHPHKDLADQHAKRNTTDKVKYDVESDGVRHYVYREHVEKSDTNDLVEDLIKGGVGSGIKGHLTPKQIKEAKAKKQASTSATKMSPAQAAGQFNGSSVEELTEEILYREKLASNSVNKEAAKYHENVADHLIEMRNKAKKNKNVVKEGVESGGPGTDMSSYKVHKHSAEGETWYTFTTGNAAGAGHGEHSEEFDSPEQAETKAKAQIKGSAKVSKD